MMLPICSNPVSINKPSKKIVNIIPYIQKATHILDANLYSKLVFLELEHLILAIKDFL